MKYRQLGFGGLQALLVIAVIGVVSMVSIPKYKSFIAKAKLTEAFNLAGESKRKISEFYSTNGRLPSTNGEAEAMKTFTLSPPEYVKDMVLETNSQNHEIIIKVYLKQDIFENVGGDEQYIYIAGDRSHGSGYSISWSCGSNGVNANLLPDNCGA